MSANVGKRGGVKIDIFSTNNDLGHLIKFKDFEFFSKYIINPG